MRVLVVGASGFLGRHVVAQARDQGHDVVGTQCRGSDPSLVRFDLSRDGLWERLPDGFLRGEGQLTAIVTATYGRLDAVAQNPEASAAVNVTGMVRLLEDLLAAGVPTVYVSTNAVFDGKRGNYLETEPMTADSEYGRQKAAVERHFARRTQEFCVVRPEKMVGDDPREDNLFSHWLQLCRTGRAIECVQGQRLCPTSVDDVAQALLLAASRGMKGVYHVANPERMYREELARLFLAATGLEAPVLSRTHEELGLVERRPHDWSVDSSKWRHETGMSFTSVRQILSTFASRIGSPAGSAGVAPWI